MILTFHKPFLDLNQDKFKLQLMGTTWMNKMDQTKGNVMTIYKKNKLCSIIASNKRWTSGHKLRHVIIDYLIKNNINIVDFYGGRFNNLPQKINGLKDYMFSITIENCKSDYYFTEKLIDCFLTGTVPIFWGCPSIHKFFNVKGMLIFNTLQECINIINTLTIEKYTRMLPYIKENFETAKKYTRFKFNEEAIMELINK